jgi:hypothetical protein
MCSGEVTLVRSSGVSKLSSKRTSHRSPREAASDRSRRVETGGLLTAQTSMSTISLDSFEVDEGELSEAGCRLSKTGAGGPGSATRIDEHVYRGPPRKSDA